MAAQLLAEAGWVDPFLFVVVLGENVTPSTTTTKHPLLLIQREDYDAFFTQTFSPIVEMRKAIYLQSQEVKHKDHTG